MTLMLITKEQHDYFHGFSGKDQRKQDVKALHKKWMRHKLAKDFSEKYQKTR